MVTVIAGEVEITATGGERVGGGSGLMVGFAAAKRDAVLARTAARLLPLLTPDRAAIARGRCRSPIRRRSARARLSAERAVTGVGGTRSAYGRALAGAAASGKGKWAKQLHEEHVDP